MSSQSNRMSFTVTPTIETRLGALKKQLFYDTTQSEMIRTLIEAGIESIADNPAASANKQCTVDSAHRG